MFSEVVVMFLLKQGNAKCVLHGPCEGHNADEQLSGWLSAGVMHSRECCCLVFRGNISSFPSSLSIDTRWSVASTLLDSSLLLNKLFSL